MTRYRFTAPRSWLWFWTFTGLFLFLTGCVATQAGWWL